MTISAYSLMELATAAASAPMVEITMEDRIEFGRALILQGYAPHRAAIMAEGIQSNDGALQMLARHRVAYQGRERA